MYVTSCAILRSPKNMHCLTLRFSRYKALT
jgi:hypothetical protein